MKRSKRVVFLSLNYKPSVGGLVTYIDSFSKYLVSEDIEVSVYCSDAKQSHLPRRETIDNCKVNRFAIFDFSPVLKVFTPILVCFKLIRFLRQENFEKFDLLVIRHLYFAFAIAFIPQARNKSIFIAPLVTPKLERINNKSTSFMKRAYSYFIRPQLRFIELTALRRLKHIGALSQSKSKEFSEYYRLKSSPEVIYPGVDQARFLPLSESQLTKRRSELAKSLKVKEDSFFIVTVCRLVEEKNIRRLIQSVIALNQADSSRYSLLIVGDGPLLHSLTELVREQGAIDYVKFIGNVIDPETYLQVSDLFVLPSIYEGFGHVYIEANACGVPIVGVRNRPPKVITASDEIIAEGRNGYLSSSPAVTSLVSTIGKAYLELSSKTRSEIQAECLAVVSERFTWKTHFEHLMKMRHGKT